MKTKECPICGEEATLVDAGLDTERDVYYRRWECIEGHEHTEHLPEEPDAESGMATDHNESGSPSADLGTMRRLNRLLDRLGVGQ